MLSGCGGSSRSSGGGGGSGGGGSSGSSGSVATDCVRVAVTDNGGSSTISPELDGDWPSNGTTYADVTFTSNPNASPQTFSQSGQSVDVTDPGGGMVGTAVVWVTGDNTSPIHCATCARQP